MIIQLAIYVRNFGSVDFDMVKNPSIWQVDFKIPRISAPEVQQLNQTF